MHDEEEFVPSPLLAGLPLMQATRVSDSLIPSPVMESIHDGQGPPINVDSYHAGSGALKDQSQCPFRSFVVHRLKSRPSEEPQPGNDPRLRGQLVHKIMELLWLQWKTSDQLRSLSEEQLSTTVRETIEQVLQGVQAVVAGRVGDQERALVGGFDEAGVAAARRGVDAILGVGAGDDDERRERDETPAVGVELLHRALRGLAVQRAQRGEGENFRHGQVSGSGRRRLARAARSRNAKYGASSVTTRTTGQILPSLNA